MSHVRRIKKKNSSKSSVLGSLNLIEMKKERDQTLQEIKEDQAKF